MVSRFTNLIDLNDMPVDWWNKVVSLGAEIADDPEKYAHECDGKIMATLFYEPSTRTQMSFQAAMLKLGGTIIGFDNPATSSVAKGENLKDTTKIVSNYADIMIMRHPSEGSAKAAALTADCPIINAGDGGHLHPTQTLTDLLTLSKEKGRLEDLTIGLCGDLKNGRTVHSLCKALSCCRGNRFVLISTPELRLPFYIKDILTVNNCEYKEVNSIEEAIGSLDVLYMTRIQRERFSSPEEYEKQKDVYCLDRAKMAKAKPDLCVLHPLPRVDEIAIEVDDDPRALYFKQAKYGMYVRMALILTVLKNEYPTVLLEGKVHKSVCCTNKNCITQKESYIPKSFRGSGDTLECEYCDERVLRRH
ncbi:MAG: aspartate carbamoyltransferase [Oscillospiraceae bacterium]|nr:aspartate carbamoyltransferase [Oscillospiraceae bacterium]